MSVTVMSLPICRSLPTLPVVRHEVAIAEVVGTQLDDGFGSVVAPELFGALHSSADLFHHRLHEAADDGETLLAVFRIFHLVLIVGQVTQALGYNTAIAC